MKWFRADDLESQAARFADQALSEGLKRASSTPVTAEEVKALENLLRVRADLIRRRRSWLALGLIGGLGLVLPSILLSRVGEASIDATVEATGFSFRVARHSRVIRLAALTGWSRLASRNQIQLDSTSCGTRSTGQIQLASDDPSAGPPIVFDDLIVNPGDVVNFAIHNKRLVLKIRRSVPSPVKVSGSRGGAEVVLASDQACSLADTSVQIVGNPDLELILGGFANRDLVPLLDRDLPISQVDVGYEDTMSVDSTSFERSPVLAGKVSLTELRKEKDIDLRPFETVRIKIDRGNLLELLASNDRFKFRFVGSVSELRRGGSGHSLLPTRIEHYRDSAPLTLYGYAAAYLVGLGLAARRILQGRDGA